MMGFYTINCSSIENVNWEKQPVFEIAENTICIWRIRIVPEITRIENFSALLKPGELERANRYYHEKDRKRFITSRGALRILLGHYIKKNPLDIELIINPDKKPSLKEPFNLHYNTSHSENDILIAIANSEVGIDVEKEDVCFNWENVLHSNFTIEENRWVNESKNPKTSFYLLWTRKEALAKAAGKGLQDDLSVFPSLDGTHSLRLKEFSNSWEVTSFKIEKDVVGSVANSPSITNRKFFNMNPVFQNTSLF